MVMRALTSAAHSTSTAFRPRFTSQLYCSAPLSHRFADHNAMIISRPCLSQSSLPRFYSDAATAPVDAPDYLSEGERKIFDKIKEELKPTALEVQDISGGCGSMYALNIVSAQFRGLPVIKQHRLVNKVLGEEIKKWHGVQLRTSAPAP